MKALFYTTQTVDCSNHVRAWNSAFPKAEHLTYNHNGIRNDWQMLEAAQRIRPDVVFWIGAHQAPGNPKCETFKKVRDVAPLVNLCSDAADKPWHHFLKLYDNRGCFDLQVAIDGAHEAPVDLAVLTPIDSAPFAGGRFRDIRCGFSGNVGRGNLRSEVVNALAWFGGLTIRSRAGDNSYDEHARFLKRCQMLLNLSRTGSGQRHHIKGRVLEAGWAGCALLESEGSPIGQWFAPDCYVSYGHPTDAAAIISSIDDRQIDLAARRLTEEVKARFTAKQIYTQILERAGVDTS